MSLTSAQITQATAHGVRLGLKGLRKVKRKIKFTFAERYIWWLFPTILWAVGIIILFELWKAKVKAIVEVLGVKITTGMVFTPSMLVPNMMLLGWNEFWKQLQKANIPEEAKPEIQDFFESMRLWLVLWTFICIVIGLWLYSTYQKRKWGRPVE